jgi:hypothetical protein
MKGLPILQNNDSEREELMGRIALSNRPALDIDLEFIDAIADDLALDGGKRKIFVADPTAYLSMRDLPITDCRLVASDVSLTSEACTANVVCNVNAVTKVEISTQSSQTLFCVLDCHAVATSAIPAASYGGILYTQESILLAKSLGSYGTHGVL